MAGKVPMTIQFNNQINPKMPDDLMYVQSFVPIFFRAGGKRKQFRLGELFIV